jgi:hypothetical protein
MKKLIYILLAILLLIVCYVLDSEAVSSGTYTVRQDGTGNFTSVASAEAGLQGILTSTVNIVIQSTWTTAEGGMTWTGWTTFSTAPVICTAQGGARHKGIWTDTAHRFQADKSGTAMIFFGSCKNIYLDGLQIHNLNTAGSGTAQSLRNNSTTAGRTRIISNCLIRTNKTGEGTSGFYDADAGRSLYGLYNNIFYLCDTATNIYATGNGTTYYYYNNTFSSNATGCYGASTVVNCVLYAKNNLSQFNATDFDFTGWQGVTETATNVSQDATSPDTNYRNQTSSFTNRNGFNFHLLATDTTAHLRGTDLRTDPIQPVTTDIDGNIIYTPTDIGADYILATRKKRCITIIQ